MKRTSDEFKPRAEEICYKPQEVRPWLLIFRLPSEPVWYVTLFIINYLVVLEALYSSVNKRCLDGSYKLLVIAPDVAYAIDLVLTLLVQFVKRLHLSVPDVVKRPLLIVLSDLYSLIPQQLLYSGDDTFYCLMRVNRAVRFVRLSYMVYKSYNSLNRHILMYVVDFSLAFTLCGFVMFCVYCNIVCSQIAEGCTGSACDTLDFFKGIPCSMLNIVERSIEDKMVYEIVYCFFVLCAVTLGFFFRAFFAVHQIHRAMHQHVYMYRYKIMKHIHGNYNIPDYIKKGAERNYRLYWEQSMGYQNSKNCLSILSSVMSSEILIDISWPAFKHSKLFRGMDLPFLREVSMYMSQVYLLPGEVIYRKNQLKGKMIYVVSGTISILSDEDGESPIISFTSGTIIGETSLYVSMRSTNYLQCKTFCQLHILEQKDFIKVSSKFPREYHVLKSMIYERFKFAKESNKIVLEVRENFTTIHRDIDVYTIFWLKNVLHALMSIDADSTYRHDFQNVHLTREAKQTNLRNLLFCAKDLDMLAITERIEKTQDANFARLKFPYIIHSTSVVLKFWEIFVVLWTLLFSFIIPYMMIVSTELPGWYYPLILTGTIVFITDIYVQISTTMKMPYGVLSTITEITVQRFQTFGFWMDILSCFPFEVFTPIVIMELTGNNKAKMHINRVLKIWRINRLFKVWMHSSSANHSFIIYLKYTWFMSCITFSLFMYLRYENPSADQLQIIFISAQWARNLDYAMNSTQGYLRSNFTVKPMIEEYMFLIILAFHGSVAFIRVVQHFNFLTVQQISFELLSMVKTENLKSFSNRVINYLLAQWQTSYCYYLHKHELKQVYSSRTALSETQDVVLGDDLRNIPLFACFGDSFSHDACSIMNVVIFSPMEVITYYGCIARFIYVILKGTCEVLDEQGNRVKLISGTYSCNVMEVLLKTPNVNTYKAVTHCMILRFDRSKLLRKLARYEFYFTFFKTFLKSCADMKATLGNMSKLNVKSLKMNYVKNKNFVVFPVNMKKDSFEEYDYYNPYDKLYPFSNIRYFFLRCSITPDGKFLYVWEWIRSCIVLITNVCYFYPTIIVNHGWVLHMLDLLGLAHIYIRLHVCYYTKDGILVTHPLETARQYMRNGFFVDLFSVIPFRYLFGVTYDLALIVINANHLLQLHSYLQLMNLIKKDIIAPRSKWCGVLYAPFIIVICNLLGMILFTMECTINEEPSDLNSTYIGYNCISDSILASSPFSPPISLQRAHLYYVYVGTALMTNIPFQGPEVTSKVGKCTFMIILVVSLYVSVNVTSQMQELQCFRQGYLLENQIAMKHLKKFLETTVRDSKLKKVVVRYCELKWLRLKGQGIFELVKPFTISLRNDILYEFFGVVLRETSPFKGNASLFYKNLLHHLKFDLIVKGGFLQTINDVDDQIYILYQGMADVLAPDGTTLETLQAGSLLGNITDKDRARLKLSVIAMTHVEVLMCNTNSFMKVLRYYPHIRSQFETLREKYMYYIPTKPGVVKVTEGQTGKTSRSLFTKVLEPNCHFVRVWNFLYLTFACYLGIIIDVYQMGAGDFSYSLFTIQYLCDLMYLAHFLLQDRIAYENEWGYMVYDLEKIKRKNRKNKTMLVITIISMIPLDVLIYSLNPDMFHKGGTSGLYRLNRCLRIVYLINYIKTQCKKLDVNIFLMKLLTLVMWTFLIVNGFASILAWVSCSLKPNLYPEIPDWESKANWNSSACLRLHITFLYTTWSAFTLSRQHYYIPQGAVHIGLLILMMIAGYFCYMAACCEVFSMVNEMYMKKGQYFKLYQHIKYFLFTQDVSASLRMKCLSICSVLWRDYEGEMFPRLLEDISPYLRDATMNCAFFFFIGAHPLFEKCHTDFIRQIIQTVKYRIYYAGEYIQFKGAIDATMYFVFNGQVNTLVDEYMHNDKVVEVLYKGDCFGINQGLHKMPHAYSYRCKTTTTILSLCLQDWGYLLAYFPASRQILYKGAKVI